MKIVCLISSLGTGGAERQLVELAVGLKFRGHDVEFLIYHSDYYFEPILNAAGIKVKLIARKSKFELILNTRFMLNKLQPDILISYLTGPNAVALLSSLGKTKWKVIVTELSLVNHKRDRSHYLKVIRQLYKTADWVISNSFSGLNFIHDNIPVIKDKSSVIWNGIDLEKFNISYIKKNDDVFKFLCVASMIKIKNAPRVIEALNIVRNSKPRQQFQFRWIGHYYMNNTDSQQVMNETLQLVKKYSLEDTFSFLGNVENVAIEMQASDSLVLCSLSEGLPNAVCEGMACGLPIVASEVSDVPMFVKEGVNGFLCNPLDVNSIADAMLRCINLPKRKISSYSMESRKNAELLFSKKRFLDDYEGLFFDLLNAKAK